MDPERSGCISVFKLQEVVRGGEAVAHEGAGLLGEALAESGIPKDAVRGPPAHPPSAQELRQRGDSPPSRPGVAPRVQRSNTSEIRRQARCMGRLRRQVGEELFVCLGGTLLLRSQSRKPPSGITQRMLHSVRSRPHPEERVVRLVPGAFGRPPSLSWERPSPVADPARAQAPEDCKPTRATRVKTKWRNNELPLDRVVALVYAPLAPIAAGAAKDKLLDRALSFSLLTRDGRSHSFVAGRTSDVRAWVLSLGRILCARGALCRTNSVRSFVLRRVQVRIEALSASFGMSVGQVWMVALRRSALSLRKPHREYRGKLGTCIAP